MIIWVFTLSHFLALLLGCIGRSDSYAEFYWFFGCGSRSPTCSKQTIMHRISRRIEEKPFHFSKVGVNYTGQWWTRYSDGVYMDNISDLSARISADLRNASLMYRNQTRPVYIRTEPECYTEAPRTAPVEVRFALAHFGRRSHFHRSLSRFYIFTWIEKRCRDSIFVQSVEHRCHPFSTLTFSIVRF